MTETFKQEYRPLIKKQRVYPLSGGKLDVTQEGKIGVLVERIKNIFPDVPKKLIIYYIKTSMATKDDEIFEEVSKIFVSS